MTVNIIMLQAIVVAGAIYYLSTYLTPFYKQAKAVAKVGVTVGCAGLALVPHVWFPQAMSLVTISYLKTWDTLSPALSGPITYLLTNSTVHYGITVVGTLVLSTFLRRLFGAFPSKTGGFGEDHKPRENQKDQPTAFVVSWNGLPSILRNILPQKTATMAADDKLVQLTQQVRELNQQMTLLKEQTKLLHMHSLATAQFSIGSVETLHDQFEKNQDVIIAMLENPGDEDGLFLEEIEEHTKEIEETQEEIVEEHGEINVNFAPKKAVKKPKTMNKSHDIGRMSLQEILEYARKKRMRLREEAKRPKPLTEEEQKMSRDELFEVLKDEMGPKKRVLGGHLTAEEKQMSHQELYKKFKKDLQDQWIQSQEALGVKFVVCKKCNYKHKENQSHTCFKAVAFDAPRGGVPSEKQVIMTQTGKGPVHMVTRHVPNVEEMKKLQEKLHEHLPKAMEKVQTQSVDLGEKVPQKVQTDPTVQPVVVEIDDEMPETQVFP
jgi:hypothetical protein